MHATHLQTIQHDADGFHLTLYVPGKLLIHRRIILAHLNFTQSAGKNRRKRNAMIAGFIISGSGETICVVSFIILCHDENISVICFIIISGHDDSLMLFALPFPIVMVVSILPICSFTVTMIVVRLLGWTYHIYCHPLVTYSGS